jgi:uncharacterized membrane protein
MIGSTSAPDDGRIIIKTNTSYSNYESAAGTLVSSGLIIIFTIMAVVINYRNVQCVRQKSPKFIIVSLIGCLLLVISAMFLL